MSSKGTHFVLSKKKNKIFLRDPVFPEGGRQAQCFVLIYRRSKFVQGGPLRFWLTIDGRKIAKPLDHGESCLIGVKPGKHVLDVKMPYTGLVNLDKKLETRELEPGEMQVIEMAICGLTIPYTKVWDLGKMHCPIAVIEKKKKKEKSPPPEEEKTTTTTTTTYTAQLLPVIPPPQIATTTMYSTVTPTTTTTTYAPAPMPMQMFGPPQSMYFPTGQAPFPPMAPMSTGPPISGYNPFLSPAPMSSMPQTGGMMFSPMMMPQNMQNMNMQPMQNMNMQNMNMQPMQPMQQMQPMQSMSPAPMQPFSPSPSPFSHNSASPVWKP